MYDDNTPIDPSWYFEMRDPRMRARILGSLISKYQLGSIGVLSSYISLSTLPDVPSIKSNCSNVSRYTG